jgi:uncharacterized protein (DUF58 family)
MFAVLLVPAVALVAWAFSRAEPELIMAAAIVIAVVIDGVTTARILRTVDVEVRNPLDVIIGQPVTYAVTLRGMRRPITVAPPPPYQPYGATVIDERPVHLTLPAPARGVARHLVLDLHSGGPLGLFHCTRRARVTFTSPMYVGPPAIPHEVRWPYLHTQRLGLTPTSAHGRDLFRGVREYVPGDARRDVHWSATAHHRRLMVQEHDGTGIISLRIVVTMSFFGLAADEAAGRAAWLAEDGLRRGWEVHLVTVEAAEPPDLLPLVSRGADVQSMYPVAPRVVRTVDQTVESRGQVRRRLAAAAPGPLELPGATASHPAGRWRGPTRVIAPGGDRWD